MSSKPAHVGTILASWLSLETSLNTRLATVLFIILETAQGKASRVLRMPEKSWEGKALGENVCVCVVCVCVWGGGKD